MQLSWCLKQQIQQKITRMIYNCRFHFKVKMMLYTQELYSWDHQQVSLLELSLIQALSTWPLLLYFVTMKQLEITNSRSMTHYPVDLQQEIKCIRDVKQWLTTCINLTQIKYSQRPLPSSLMDQPSFKDSSGKIILAYSRLRGPQITLFSLSWSLNPINVLSSNSQLYTNLKDLAMTLMEFLVFPLTKT